MYDVVAGGGIRPEGKQCGTEAEIGNRGKLYQSVNGDMILLY